MSKFAINGYANIGGQQRMVIEMLRELDKFVKPGLLEVVVPKNYTYNENYNNIKIIRIGKGPKVLWIQTFFLFYLVKRKKIGINLYNTCPLLKPDIMTIYDMTLEVCKKEICTSYHGKIAYIYNKLLRRIAIYNSKLIFTASNTSKHDIMKYYNDDGERIVALYDGWQHMSRIEADYRIFDKHPELEKKAYYLSVSSIIPHKNFKWVKEVAKRNKSKNFAIVGAKTGGTNKEDIVGNQNLIYLGRVTDEEMKALMRECKAFIHPALYEGFGIPPLEAISQNAQIIISNKGSLPEIYGTSAHYINPMDYNVDLDVILEETVDSAEKVLDKYSWRHTAEIFYNAIERYN